MHAPDVPLRVPIWVQARIARLGRDFVGQIVLNYAPGGGMTNFQIRPRGGDAVTIHPKR